MYLKPDFPAYGVVIYPFIEQCVERIEHQCSSEELMQIERDTECLAFARAIK